MSVDRTIVCISGVGGTPGEWDGVSAPMSVFGHVAARIPAGGALILVGHSEGGVQALRIASRQFDRVDAIVLTSSFFPPARGGRSRAAAALAYGRHRVLYIRELATRSRRPNPTRRGFGQIASVARLGLRPAAFHRLAASIRCPVLVLHGGQDHVVPITFARAAVAAHPARTFRELPAAGHHPHRDLALAWGGAVSKWLRAVL
jgi:pimeloyl-ACP methyl ester carboxylesterase